MAEHDKEDHIFIDKKKVDVPRGSTFTGSQLRGLVDPPIADDRDLYQEVPGDEDLLIADDASVTVRNGMHFFSVPKTINPGQ